MSSETVPWYGTYNAQIKLGHERALVALEQEHPEHLDTIREQTASGIEAICELVNKSEPTPAEAAYQRLFKAEESKFMNPRFAVFNGDVNDAHERALIVLGDQFPEFREELVQYEDGIMEIFNVHHTPAILKYVELVTGFVNEGK